MVVKNSYIDSTIAPAGWKIWSATDPRTDHITFAEYNNSGPSSWENNAAARQAFGFATLLTSDTFSLSSVMDSTEWIDTTYWDTINTPVPATAVPAGPTNITVSGNSTVDGTTPPSGALIVSKTPIDGLKTYQTIQDALNAAPTSSKLNATVFIYPGVYNEQLIVNKSGTTIFMGYSNATDDYAQNQVSIEFSHGIDTQGTDGSDTDGATVYATGNYFYAYNINFRNRAGTTQNIASLGFAVKSSKFAALFACQIYGNQDTLDISGNLFTFKTYIEGNVDFIFGNGAAYFLDSTISPNEDGISITADKRVTNTTAGGLVFDQCTLKPAAGTGPFKNIGLGRPWNSNARVAFIDCYFDSMISAAGWNQWSKSSPQTAGVTFGEYHNYGPGSSTCGRASFSQQLSDADVVQFQLSNFFASTKFIDFSRVDTQPFTVGIGSAQTCATASVSSSMVSSTSSLPLSSSLPVVTVYTTSTAVVKLTASTTLTQSDVTSTTVIKVTSTASITGADVTKTEISKETATVVFTSPDVTSTSTVLITENLGLTITPNAITKSNVVKATTTVDGTTTARASIFTVKGTFTSPLFHTVSLKPTTLTQSEGSTTTIKGTVTPKDASTTVKTTISFAPSSTKTTTVKAKSSATVSTLSLKTVTKTTTTTASCVPTEPVRLARRGAVIPRADVGTVTITLSTEVTSYVKTTTATQAGSTALVTETSIAKVKTYTQPGASSTVSVTSFVKTKTVAQPGSTYWFTETSTRKIGKTTTLEASTVTVLSTSYITQQQLHTVTPNALTTSNIVTKTSTQVITAPQQTVYITKSADVTSTVRTTLPVSTRTVFQTISLGGGVVTSTITAPPGTKTVVAKSTTTIWSVVTKLAKNAQACAN